MITLSRRFTGLVLVVLGAWAGILPYVGPLFGFRMDGTPSWTWTTAHWELNLAPGALVLLGGVLLLAGRRGSTALGGLFAVLGGAWLVVGPLFASLWLTSGAQTRVASSTLAAAMRPLGYHYGTGLVIVVLGAWVIGRRALEARASGAGYAPMRTHRRAPAAAGADSAGETVTR